MSRGFRGVKDDLSEIGRRLLNAAYFIAPLIAVSSESPPNPDEDDDDDARPRLVAGAMNDLAEFGGELKSGIARISSALNWRIVDRRDDASSNVEIRKEILRFIRDLAKSSESWTEFPLPVDDYFDLSCHQKDHIATVERLVPSLATLRVTLCPQFMNEETFWKIYFALLHPRLNEHEYEFLSTQQIVEEMRTNMKKKKMQSRVNTESQNLEPGSSGDTKHEMVHENHENNLQNRMNSESQNPVAESFSLMMNENREPKSSSSMVSLKAGDVKEGGETDANTHSEPQISTEGNYLYIEAENVDNIVRISGQDYVQGSHKEWLELHQYPVSVDHDGISKQLICRGLRDEESSDWHAVEGISDFEIVERS